MNSSLRLGKPLPSSNSHYYLCTVERQTEKESLYNNLEEKSTLEILTDINREDAKIAAAVNMCIPEIALLVEEITKRMSEGGRLFYTGAGTSGRLGIVDASECP